MSNSAPETLRQIDDLVKSAPVVLFMKGSRSFPQCGFSATVVQILNSLLPEYKTVNVLADAAIRQGIKDYSSWPTIPQLYVGGEFVGGCDIVREMFASGELHRKLGVEAVKVEAPAVTVTPAAVEALRSALADAGPDDHLHLAVTAGFEHDLSLGPKRPGELEVVSNGLALLVDPMSADKLRGVTIDYVSGAGGAGFKIDNPNKPAAGQVIPIAARDLAAKLQSGEIRELYDVRSPDEIRLAKIEGARPLDAAALEHLETLDRSTPIALYCHHGMRSRSAGQKMAELGFQKVYNLTGGIDAWSQDVDPKVPRY
ncbi:MAG TPA: Grx4 family monothiol glutaredoxin [Kofleriaceae bacterium]|nr:Grx4 family monothiol glutaredoxin [Kofleriaceae bacterium]